MKQANFLSRDTFLFVAALVIGMCVNMALIYVGIYLVPLPDGVDINTREGLKAALPLLEFSHFVFPYLAHAMGTFTGAYCIVRWASIHKQRRALVVGAVFFIGGCINMVEMPSPYWFLVADLTLAYFPMAWLAYRIAA